MTKTPITPPAQKKHRLYDRYQNRFAGAYQTNPIEADGRWTITERPATNATPLMPFPEGAGNNVEAPLWRSKNLLRWTRIRLLSDPGYTGWDISYIYAQLTDGSVVRCSYFDLPGLNGDFVLPKPLRLWKAAAIVEAESAGIYLTGTGLWDALSTLHA